MSLSAILRKLAAIAAIAVPAVAGLGVTNAAAVPAFAVQTGEPCQGCHVGGFGPQLTPFGREFKLQGYTLRSNDWNVPLSVMAVASYLHTAKDQNPPPAPFDANNNWALDQVSLFLATGIGQHFGAFVQGTYDGVAEAWTWDNLDLRAVTTTKFGKHDATLGVSLNNNPSVQDVWNTLPAWGYPYTGSALAPSPSASPLFNGALAQASIGMTGYAWIDSKLYLEAGAYWSPRANTLIHLGADPTSPGDISGASPYLRAAWQQDLGPGTFEAGVFGMESEIFPGMDHTTGFTDRYTDVGVDGSYVWARDNGDTITANARYIHEDQSLKATCTLEGAPIDSCAGNRLDDFRIDGSYYWRGKIGLTAQVFDTTGSANPVIYAGNSTFKPDSSGVMLQIDGTPWGDGKGPLGKRFNTRVGLQYTAYGHYNGARTNWDGAGSNASDNNTLRLFIWSAY
ncbi:MAG TPA: hypothetical protein VMT68_12165 [Caulobacteraceae bacterium]|nr:hypothetical protein [Caulobacteraceae bacterium]